MRRRSGAVAAVDLGATSGRVIVGHLDGPDLRLRHVARFPNEPVRTRDGLHWDLLGLYRHVLDGLTAAERENPGEIESIGIDSWAVDYGLLRDGRLLGLPYHYRDERALVGVEHVHARVGPAELYARNGLQHLPFNTIFQLATEGTILDVADQMLLVPDLLTYWLTGARVAERTNASTTGLLDPRTGTWDLELARRAGIPERVLPPLVDPGTSLGRLSPEVATLVGRDVPVVAVGSHDTASAVVAVPADDRDVAFVSCGTWGLVGLELDSPVVSEQARLAGFTNEGGVDGRTRFLHNVMGLWLLSESIRTWDRAATVEQRSSTLHQLLDAAAAVSTPVTVFDVDDPRFLAPGDIPTRIAEWCREHDRPVPATRGEVVRSIVESLAQAFADAAHDAARLAGRPIHAIHVVGGGAQNALLCQATADRSGLPVLAGPVEATAIGNVLVQARAAGIVTGELEDLRALVRASTVPTRYVPRPSR
ncbi:rhamnulokinase [Cellulosimicrobium terreum]|nr:rhamnulokinase [Cellulosimicrobium terreum]